ncbi:MAG: CoA transferase [Gammaproteobacteria bacterium]|nr:CoA transferase [Gammaproteobacteria bacterium]
MAALPKHILNGYRVLDMTHVLAGPTASRLMAEMGAEVIKVEFPPQGDVSRVLPAHKNGRSGYYTQQNRGKRSICLNAKTPEGRAILTELLKTVDVFIENFAPGVIGRMGFSWEAVHKINPRVVMCSISAFGQSGPLSSLPGFDYIAQAYSGVMGMIGDPNGPPSFPMVSMGDISTGVHAAAAIGFALLHRERGGEGQYLDISLLDAYTGYHELNIHLYSLTNGEVEPTRSGSQHFAVCPLGLFKSRDGYVCIIALQNQWAPLCRAIGRPELIDDPRYCDNAQRVAHASEVIAILQAWCDQQPDDEAILAALQAERVPCAPVLRIGQVVSHPHMLERGTVRVVKDPKLGEVLMPGMPLRFSGFEHNQPLDAAYLGEHNEAVLSEVLGYDAARIEALRAAGVLYANPET